MKTSCDETLLWNGKRYLSVDYYWKQKFGCKVTKIQLDAGFSCPNRDGLLGTSGCIFCSGRGSADFAGQRYMNLQDQFIYGKNLRSNKWPTSKYIAYLQGFSNTYDDPAKLMAIYHEALAGEDVVGLAIATRPDCLSLPVIEVLKQFDELTYLSIEIGLQSIHEKSMQYLKLGYNLNDFFNAVKMLNNKGIEICVHIILGLPGETAEDMLSTIKYLASLPIQGIKIHMLNILEGTELGNAYNTRPFTLLSQPEYIELVADSLEHLPPTMVIHRLTGDGPKDILIAPQWVKNKRAVLNDIDKTLKARNSWQGKQYRDQTI